jgi:hypothetical protein
VYNLDPPPQATGANASFLRGPMVMVIPLILILCKILRYFGINRKTALMAAGTGALTPLYRDHKNFTIMTEA